MTKTYKPTLISAEYIRKRDALTSKACELISRVDVGTDVDPSELLRLMLDMTSLSLMREKELARLQALMCKTKNIPNCDSVGAAILKIIFDLPVPAAELTAEPVTA